MMAGRAACGNEVIGSFIRLKPQPVHDEQWHPGERAEIPVRHLANALLAACNPHTKGLGFSGPDLLILAAWGAAGLLIALRKFTWLPLGR